jgi:SDR family mycofactocin-dependent oxidoreductase
VPEGRLSGRVALVTGAARGQGRAHAVALAHEGADLIICDICAGFESTAYPGTVPADLGETVELVQKEGQRVVSRQVDVRDFGALASLVSDGVRELGRLDVVVANAGIDSAAFSWEITEQQWDEVMDTNLKGVWHTAKAAIPTMISQGWGGSIILISSTGGRKGLPFKAHYTAAKHGVVGLCRVMAMELGEYDIRVNTVHPAGVDTMMVTDPHLQELIASKAETLGPVFMNSLPTIFMQPDDISRYVVFLASDESRYSTGAQFVVDMGNTSR